MKELIITKKFNTAKELINYILKEKYKNNIDFIKINHENYNLLKSNNLIVEWESIYPGVVWYHVTVAGVLVEVINV